ncbi:hypothetical protein VL15_30545 [Burkholderia cepacia]|uniref:Uncharacterized protein n=1 Tax=Burkholderia cepacia TaxID=292 RepID=A0A0J5WLI8_BURCE|nr:hypothetical protein VL15_30545 [Burkholderia cepacia]
MQMPPLGVRIPMTICNFVKCRIKKMISHYLLEPGCRNSNNATRLERAKYLGKKSYCVLLLQMLDKILTKCILKSVIRKRMALQ